MTKPKANSSFYVQWKGRRELQALFNRLDVKMERKHVRRGLAKVMQVLAKSIKRQVPKAKTKGHSNRNLKRSVGWTVKLRDKRTKKPVAKVGFNVGVKAAKRGQKPKGRQGVYYAPFVFIGTARRKTKRSKANRGRIVGNNTVPRAVGIAITSAMSQGRARIWMSIQADAKKGG